jgi:gluconolactonase
LTAEGYPKRIFADLPVHQSGNPLKNLPDGLAVDKEGRIWVAHYGMQAIQVLSRDGDPLYSLDTQLPLTSNLCFLTDEPGLKVLMVTGGYQEPGPGAVIKMTVSF